ncbi:MAG: hypothetical protein ABW278_08525 [Steroidobacteraceae bacterium]
MSPTELWLPIGALAFYLYDATLLLWQNELVYTRTAAGWKVHGGSPLRLGGRRVFLPQLLLPYRPQFLVRWSAADARAGAAPVPDTLLRALRPIGVVNFLQLLLLLALPVALWTQGAGLAALAVFALFYLLTVVALVLVHVRRPQLALSRRAFWLQALDALFCAPFAINLTRKLAALHGIAGEPLRFAAAHFDAATLERTRELVGARVREEHADPDAQMLREQQLAAMLSRLD